MLVLMQPILWPRSIILNQQMQCFAHATNAELCWLASPARTIDLQLKSAYEKFLLQAIDQKKSAKMQAMKFASSIK